MENQPVDDSEHPNHTPEWSPLREPTVAQRASERKSKDLSGVAIKIVAVFLVLLVAQQFWNSLVVEPNRNRLFENQLRENEKRLREIEKRRTVATEITSAATGMKLVLIPAGEFMMGSTSADIDRLVKDFSNTTLLHEEFEKPAQLVKISRSFYMGQYEVTTGEFAKFVASEDFKTEAERDGKANSGYDMATQKFKNNPKYTWRRTGWASYDENNPVVNVTWNDAKAFCKWLSKMDGRLYRLPTEAEWEYACRALTLTRHPGGDQTSGLRQIANIADQSLDRTPGTSSEVSGADFDDGYPFTAPVGSFAPNGFGLYDMIGNVFEWCEDISDYKLYQKRGRIILDPLVTSGSNHRVLRGSSWLHGPRDARSARRSNSTPDSCSYYIGFRVVAIDETNP